MPGTIGPSGAYAPSMFDDIPAPPAPLSMFDIAALVDEREPETLPTCPACGGVTSAHGTECETCTRSGVRSVSMF